VVSLAVPKSPDGQLHIVFRIEIIELGIAKLFGKKLKSGFMELKSPIRLASVSVSIRPEFGFASGYRLGQFLIYPISLGIKIDPTEDTLFGVTVLLFGI